MANEKVADRSELPSLRCPIINRIHIKMNWIVLITFLDRTDRLDKTVVISVNDYWCIENLILVAEAIYILKRTLLFVLPLGAKRTANGYRSNNSGDFRFRFQILSYSSRTYAARAEPSRIIYTAMARCCSLQDNIRKLVK